MNSLTVNLHLMMVSFFRPDAQRNCVLIESSAFPSDRYAVVSQLEFHGLNAARNLIEVEPRDGERNLRTEDLIDRIAKEGSRLALVLLPGVQYLTGQALELAPLIAAARRVGAAVGLDLAHSIGNYADAPARLECRLRRVVQLQISERRPRRRRRLLRARAARRAASICRASPAGGDTTGDSRFLFEQSFDPSGGAQGWQISNPPILSTAPLLASLEIFQRAGMPALREKSLDTDRLLAAAHRRAAAGLGRDHHPWRTRASAAVNSACAWRCLPPPQNAVSELSTRARRDRRLAGTGRVAAGSGAAVQLVRRRVRRRRCAVALALRA